MTNFVGPPPGSASFKNFIAATAGTAIKSGVGSLFSVVVGVGVASSTITLYDGTSTSGTPIATVSAAAPIALDFGVTFKTGLFAVVVGAPNVTVNFV